MEELLVSEEFSNSPESSSLTEQESGAVAVAVNKDMFISENSARRVVAGIL